MDPFALRSTVAALVGLVLSGCAGPTPEADGLELADAEAAVGDYAIIPDGRAPGLEVPSPPTEPIADPTPALGPRLVVVEPDDPRCEVGHNCVQPELCSFAVLENGLPALRSDEAVVAHVVHSPIPWTDIDLAIDGLDGDRRSSEAVFDENALGELPQAEIEAACDAARTRLQARVTEINEKLSRHAWRPMAALPVEVVPGPDTAADGFEGPDTRPVAERPVQVRLRHHQYVVRIPGVRVLYRLTWEHGPNIALGRVWADEASGIALQAYFVTNPVCSAGIPEAIDARTTRLPARVFAQAIARADHPRAW